MKKKILIILCAVLISLITIVSLKTLYDNSREEGNKLISFLYVNNFQEVICYEGEHQRLSDEYGLYSNVKKMSNGTTKFFIYVFENFIEIDKRYIGQFIHKVMPIFQGEYIYKNGKYYLVKKTNYLMTNYSCEYNLFNADAPNVGDLDYDVNNDLGLVFWDIEAYVHYDRWINRYDFDFPEVTSQYMEGKLEKKANITVNDIYLNIGEGITTEVYMKYKYKYSFEEPRENSNISKLIYNLKFDLVSKNNDKVFASYNRTRGYGLIQLTKNYTIQFYWYKQEYDSFE